MACGGKAGSKEMFPLGDEEAAKEMPPVPAEVKVLRVEPTAGNAPPARSPLLDYMVEENRRWAEALKADPDEPAHYVGYQISDKRIVSLEAEGGSVLQEEDLRERFLDVDVRVGDPALDDRHILPNDRLEAFRFLPRVGRVPFTEDKLAVQSALWLETDRKYREAALYLRNVKTQTSVAARRNAPPDFSREKGHVFVEKVAVLSFDPADWRQRLRRCSLRAARGVATRSTCQAYFEENTTYFVNSEGAQVQTSWTTARLTVSVGVKADDGMPLGRMEQAYAATPAELTDERAIDRMIDSVTRDLTALHKAPIAAPYAGPALLEGRAAAVFFHEVFGHRVEGHRQKDETSGQTFTAKVNEQIMPRWLTVYDDPSITTLNGRYLNGFYRFDDEGVIAQRAMLVQEGVLKGFIMGRNPIAGFLQSNGHGRREIGRPPVSRQGNLVVEAARSVTTDELYKFLREEIRRQKKPYGIVITDISGGVTNTSRFAPQAFKVNPVMAYRLYPDGRKELVRGIDISGTPLTALASIIAAGRPVETFNGMCGAESGWVPVSASAPSVLLSQLEVERSFTPEDRPPVLAPPPPALRGTGQDRPVRGDRVQGEP
jgi:predicted Zn-dependent protease